MGIRCVVGENIFKKLMLKVNIFGFDVLPYKKHQVFLVPSLGMPVSTLRKEQSINTDELVNLLE